MSTVQLFFVSGLYPLTRNCSSQMPLDKTIIGSQVHLTTLISFLLVK